MLGIRLLECACEYRMRANLDAMESSLNSQTKTKHLVLTGFMGSGKTTVGRFLAEKIGRDFYDLDAVISNQEQMTCRQIFEMKGEPYFRKVELTALEQTLQLPAAVIALGGGSFINERARELIKQYGISFYLKTSEENLRRRIGTGKERPVLAGKSSTISQLLAVRHPVYAHADVEVITDARDANEVAEEIFRFCSQFE